MVTGLGRPATTVSSVPIGSEHVDGSDRVRRAGWLVTAASVLVAVVTLVVVAVVEPGPGRTAVILGAVALAFVLAAWRAVRARRDATSVPGLRPISSWIAAFSWAATVFAALVALAAPSSGPRAAVTGVLAGCLLVLVGRASERMAAKPE